MQRPISDDDILTFLRVNKSKYPSQIDLIQAAAQLLWPYGPPTDAGRRLARLVLHEAHHYRPIPSTQGTRPLRQTGPLGTGPLPQTSPLG